MSDFASGMFTLSKSNYTFEAAHKLQHMPEGHQCARLHGHSYHVSVAIAAPVDDLQLPEGWLFDFGALRPFKEFIDNNLDHRCLNDLMQQPTAENLAMFLHRRFCALFRDYVLKPEWVVAIGVAETASAGVTFAASAGLYDS